MNTKKVTDQTDRDRKAVAEQLHGIEALIENLLPLLRRHGNQNAMFAFARSLAENRHLSPPGRIAKRDQRMLVDWYRRRCPQIFTCQTLDEIFATSQPTEPAGPGPQEIIADAHPATAGDEEDLDWGYEFDSDWLPGDDDGFEDL
jgi:hypothetical protein